MILDPYIVKATIGVTSKEVFEAFAKLYPEYLESKSDADVARGIEYTIENWMKKLRAKPGLALSTGRRNSARGVFTCSLLEVLGVDRPRGERNRMELAWAIIDSPVGSKNIGHTPELAGERPATT